MPTRNKPPRILDSIRHWLAPSATLPSGENAWNRIDNNAVFNFLGPGRKSAAGTHVTQLTALTIPAVWAAVSLLAEQVCQCPVRLYRTNPDGSREVVTDHPVADLLREPNTPAGLGVTDIAKHNEIQKGLWGESFFQIERGESGAAVAIWPLESAVSYATTGPRPQDRGIEGYRTLIGKQAAFLPPEEVLHFRRMTLNGFTGVSVITAARNALGLALAMEKFGSEFFANEAKSGGFIMHPGKLTDVAKKNIRESVEKQGQKTNEKDAEKVSHRLKIFEEGMKWVATTISPNESQFLESREFQISEVARLYRVPLVLMQSINGSTVWGTGIETLQIGFVNQTIRPLTVSNDDEMTRKLLSPEERQGGLHIETDVSVLLVGDALSRAQVNEIAAGGPWINRNEARRREGLNPLPGLDEMIDDQKAAADNAKLTADAAAKAAADKKTDNGGGSSGAPAAP